MKKKMKYDIVMPVMEEDIMKLKHNYPLLRRFIEFKNLILLCGGNGFKTIQKEMEQLKDESIICMEENQLLENLHYKKISTLIKERNGDVKRTGWYLQQFLKLGYSFTCQDEYYIVWDSDTVPCKKVIFFNQDNKPFFDVKTEYHKPYFNTINVLFNKKYQKNIKQSFIAEHMIFKTDLVKEMLNEIEENSNIPGKTFDEKIINAIENKKDLNHSGFSEFETYGTYIYNKYKSEYEIREWKSLREGIFYFSLPLNHKQINWISKKYDAISFEKHDTLSKLYKLWNNDFVYQHFSITFIKKMTYLYMQCRKIVKKCFK